MCYFLCTHENHLYSFVAVCIRGLLCEFNKSSYSISVASLLLCRRQPCATVLKKTPIPYAISHMMLLRPKAIYPFWRGEEKGEGGREMF